MQLSRPVIAFALLRQCSELIRTDLLSGVSVLIRPLVSDLAGQLFDSRVLSERLAGAYGVSIPAAALEGMTERLAAANVLLIERLPSGLHKVVYADTYEASQIEPDAERDFQEVLDEFLQHAHQRLAAVGKNIQDDELIKGFLHHLATLDFSAIRAKPQVVAETKPTIVGPAAREQLALSAELENQAALDSLVASYIALLQEHQPARLSLLAKVADGALAAELVFDLQAPTAVTRLNNTIVVVDTPLVLSFLDLSSSQDTTDTKNLFEQIRETGAKIAAHQHSIEEAEGVLRAIQNARNAGEAYGPSVHRLSNSMFRAYFDSMIGSIGRAWSTINHLEIIPETSTHFYKNFTQVDEEELLGAIRLSAVDRVLTRERDAKSVAETMRRLGGAHIPIGGVASCRYIFATSNSALQRRAAAFLTRKKYVLEGEFTPIVTSRYLAGLCWLMCGGRSDQSPTMARLLANCATALRVKPEIAERTKRFLADIDPEKAKHFEALMTNERASQYLVEATLGDINAVTANNAEDIFEEVQRRAAEKVAIEKDQHYSGQIAAIQESARAVEEEAERLRASLQETQHDVDARKMENLNLAQTASKLRSKHDENEAKLAQQSEQLKELTVIATEATAKASDAQRLLTEQWARSRNVAREFSDRRIKQIRGLGVFLMFSIALGLGYVDKFIIPSFPAEHQATGNLAFVFSQALFAISGFSLLVDRWVSTPLELCRKKIYLGRLTELGIPEDPVE
ncbi:hypothetical protein os4_29320 [Comamonadaceae bacterium OS-4]|nr:hypothetical protein os4_29320 [Comamonadaceae bacterium OS-4]